MGSSETDAKKGKMGPRQGVWVGVCMHTCVRIGQIIACLRTNGKSKRGEGDALRDLLALAISMRKVGL